MNVPFQEAQVFLARVLPWPADGDEPVFVDIHWTFHSPNFVKPGWTGRSCRTLSEAINAIGFAMKGAGSRDIYFCTSTQREAQEKVAKSGFKYYVPMRSQANSVALKSLFIDIDFKGGDHGYDTMDEAVTSLGNFLKATNLPRPTLVVSSGGGMHVYWTMMRALTPPEWAPLAFALAEATKKHGLKCDTQCTIDCSRILRVPDTFNRKKDEPRPVKLIGKILDFDYTVERLQQALEPYKTTITPSYQPTLPPRGALQGESDLAAGIDTSRSGPVDLKTVVPECAFVREAITTGGASFANPMWNLTTLLSTFCENGRVMAHLMGRKHPGYTQDTTDELFDRKEREKQQKNLGWPSCQTISATGCKACQTCPHFAKGKSPLNYAVRPQPAPVALVAGAPVVGAQAVTLAPASDLPNGYVRRADGVVQQVVTAEDGTATLQPVCDYRMEAPWLQNNPKMLHFTTTIEQKKHHQVMLPLELVGTMEMRRVLQEQGVMLPVGPRAMENLSRFMVNWIKQLQETREAVSSSPFGWNVRNSKLEGFVFGNRIWTPAGDQAAANPDTVIARHYAPTGETKPWVEAANMITEQGRSDLDAIIASAFGAPLVRFTGQPGVLMSAYSSESGIGKSTAMKVAQAVWGDPIKAVQSLSDTQNAVMNKLGEIRSLPLYWDELKTEEDTRKFVNITFQTTQGKEKARMTSRVTQREPGSWQTLLISASNDSLLDYVIQQTNTTTAGLIRIFEYVVLPAPVGAPWQTDPSAASLLVARLHDNYGQVGLQYAQFLGANHLKIEKEVAEYLRDLGKEVNTTQDERFWLALITVICMGAKYANQLGLAQFDLVKLKGFMLKGLDYMREQRSSQPVDMKNVANVSTLMAQFCGAMKQRHTLYTNRIHVGRGKPPPNLIKVVGDISRLDGIYVHVGVEDKRMRISSAALGNWLKEKGYSRHMVTTAMERELGLVKCNGRIGAGTGNPLLTGVTEYLLEIDLAGSPLMDFIDEQ